MKVHPKLDLVNLVVRSLLFTKLSLFTNSSLLDKEENMKKGAGVYSLNINRASSLNRGSLNPVLGLYTCLLGGKPKSYLSGPLAPH